MTRIHDGIIGLAVADALGVPVEFEGRKQRDKDPVTDMREYGTYNQPRGTWSDDTSLALSLMDSLTKDGFNLRSQGAHFVKWYQGLSNQSGGYMTPHGEVFDIGTTTIQAMRSLERGLPLGDTFDPRSAGPTGDYCQGNGSLMRILPLAFYVQQKDVHTQMRLAIDSSRVTHGHPQCQAACATYVNLASNLLRGATVEDAYHNATYNARHFFKEWIAHGLLPDMSRIFNNEILVLDRDDISSVGKAVPTLEAAIWCLLNTDTYSSAALAAVNLGNDTDTVGAVTGGLAGLTYSRESIPAEWQKDLVKLDFLNHLCDKYSESLQQ